MALLFGHPLSTYSQSLEPMWHQTSYLLISAYRASTARLESELPFGGAGGGGNRKRQANNPQIIELKKVLTRFRQCLSSEDTFYRALITRLVNFYQLQRLARDQLRLVTIPISDEVEGGGPDHGLAPDMGPEGKREKLGLIYKALICLGDLERYKEQYEDRVNREAREGKLSLSKLQERYNKAWSYYEVARALVPDDGECGRRSLIAQGNRVADQVRRLCIQSTRSHIVLSLRRLSLHLLLSPSHGRQTFFQEYPRDHRKVLAQSI